MVCNKFAPLEYISLDPSLLTPYGPMIGFEFEIPFLVPITYSADASLPKK